jgi:hypothetical protein
MTLPARAPTVKTDRHQVSASDGNAALCALHETSRSAAWRSQSQTSHEVHRVSSVPPRLPRRSGTSDRCYDPWLHPD